MATPRNHTHPFHHSLGILLNKVMAPRAQYMAEDMEHRHHSKLHMVTM
jgi:hypothetical protein